MPQLFNPLNAPSIRRETNRTFKPVDYKQKKKDGDFGEKKEKTTLEELRDKINPNIQKYDYAFNVMDYYLKDDKGDIICEYEVKSRRVRHDFYPTAVFGMNKMNHSVRQLKKGVKQIYLFNYIDGLFRWDCEDPYGKQKDEWEEGTISNDRRNDKVHKAVHIPHENLKRVSYIWKPKGKCLIDTDKIKGETPFKNPLQ